MIKPELLEVVADELNSAYLKHGNEPWKRHEFLGILLEEVRELEDEIFRGGSVPYRESEAKQEAIHIAVVCLRWLEQFE